MLVRHLREMQWTPLVRVPRGRYPFLSRYDILVTVFYFYSFIHLFLVCTSALVFMNLLNIVLSQFTLIPIKLRLGPNCQKFWWWSRVGGIIIIWAIFAWREINPLIIIENVQVLILAIFFFFSCACFTSATFSRLQLIVHFLLLCVRI